MKPKPMTVLIVDDALFMRSMIRDILIGTGRFQIVGEASNGREAVEKRSSPLSRVAAEDSFAATRLIATPNQTTAFGRGYALTPLRG